jgi:hypothetical protein
MSPYDNKKVKPDSLVTTDFSDLTGLPVSTANVGVESYVPDLPISNPSYKRYIEKGSDLVTDNKLFNDENGSSTSTPWYQNGKAMQGYANLAGVGLGLAQYFEDRKTGDIQRKGLEQNIAKAKADNQLNAVARSNLNAPMVNNKPAGAI